MEYRNRKGGKSVKTYRCWKTALSEWLPQKSSAEKGLGDGFQWWALEGIAQTGILRSTDWGQKSIVGHIIEGKGERR